MSHNAKHFAAALSLIIFGLLLGLIFYRHGFPFGHDHSRLFVLTDLFTDSFLNLNLYPRWLDKANSGYGAMDMYYYPPLFSYLTTLIDLITFRTLSAPIISYIGMYTALIASGCAFYAVTSRSISQKWSILLSLLYMLMPYHHISEIINRNAAAELMSYIWLPFIFHSIASMNNISRKKWLIYSLSYALLILSHMPTTLLVSFIIALYFLIYSGLYIRDPKRIFFIGSRFFVFTLLGIGISAIYLYPALSLLHLSNSEQLLTEYFNYQHWFLRGSISTLTPELGITYVFDTRGLLLLFSVQTAIVFYLTLPKLLECVPVLRKMKSLSYKSRPSPDFYVLLIVYVLSSFMMFEASDIIWQHIDLLKKVQFPWRLLTIIEFLCVYLIFVSLRSSPTKHTYEVALFALVLALLYTAHTAVTSPPSTASQIAIDTRKTNTLTLEFMPHSEKSEHTKFSDYLNLPKVPRINQGDGTVRIEKISENTHFVIVDAQSDVSVDLPIFYMPAWKLYDQNHNDLSDTYKLRDAAPHGQMRFNLPAGKHRLELRLTRFKEEIIAPFISLFSLLVLLVCWASDRKKGNKKGS